MSIDVYFVATVPLQLQIKYAMKTLAPIQHKPMLLSLFHIASRIEDYNPSTVSKSATPVNQTAFADLMLHPEKLAAALKIAKNENDAFDAARRFSRSVPNYTAQNRLPENNSARQPSGESLVELKMTEFHLEVPFAKSVKLAADFTDWEKYPLDMIKSEDGVWYMTVPLVPGHYSYRFIIDDKWCDEFHGAAS